MAGRGFKSLLPLSRRLRNDPLKSAAQEAKAHVADTGMGTASLDNDAPRFGPRESTMNNGEYDADTSTEPSPRPRNEEGASDGASDGNAPEPSGAEPSGAGSSDADGYDFDSSLSDFYDRLYKKLRSYGVTDIPKFSELYGLFESLLRPAIDAAIRRRQKTGRQNMAELDADAYARGMGGSSYLSSVKAREQDDIASDVTALEGQYVSSMGDYLYKALSKLQDMEAELRKTQMSIASAERRTRMSIAAADRRAYLAALAKGGAGAGTGADGDGESEPDNRIHAELGYMPYGHNKNGAYFDGQWYDGDFGYLEKDMSYGDYVRYLKKLSASERYLFFSSNDKEWRSKRWQVQYNLPQVDYLDLVEMFMPDYDPFYYGGHSGYDDDLWQNILYD